MWPLVELICLLQKELARVSLYCGLQIVGVLVLYLSLERRLTAVWKVKGHGTISVTFPI